MGEAPIVRIVRWFGERQERLRPCAYGTKVGELTEQKCDQMVSLRASREAGHRGYCSHHHEALAQHDQLM